MTECVVAVDHHAAIQPARLRRMQQSVDVISNHRELQAFCRVRIDKEAKTLTLLNPELLKDRHAVDVHMECIYAFGHYGYQVQTPEEYVH